MTKSEAIKILWEQDNKGKYVFSKRDLSLLFHTDQPKAFDEGLRRLVAAGLLKRACKGVYVNPYAKCINSFLIERIVKVLRRGHYNYVGLESALSEYGLISQIPIDRLTVMTTGRSGVYKTPYGTIEFTHTKRASADILEATKKVDTRPLRIATEETSIRDLYRVGRNIHLLQEGKAWQI